MTSAWLEHLEPPITDVIPTSTGQHIAVAVWPAAGPTFVFAPGLTSNSRNIAGVAAAMEGATTVVALDLRGRGNSSKPGIGSYGMQTHAEDVLAVMDVLGIEEAVVGGHSMGAYVATALAVAAPERCLGLVLIDGGVLITVPGMPDADTLLELTLKPVLDRLDQTFPSIDAYREHLAASPYFELGPIAEVYLRYDLGVVPGGFRPKCVRAAATEDWRDLIDNPQTASRLGEVRCPVLAIAAEEGIGHGQPAVLGAPQLTRLTQVLPDAEVVNVPSTTHHSITLSEAGALATAQALSAFTQRVTSATAPTGLEPAR